MKLIKVKTYFVDKVDKDKKIQSYNFYIILDNGKWYGVKPFKNDYRVFEAIAENYEKVNK